MAKGEKARAAANRAVTIRMKISTHKRRDSEEPTT
jgi:hypothetical protein